MNAVIENMMQRRSCRCFDPEKMPSEEVINQIAEAGTWAPTGMGMQSPVIIAVTNKQLRDKICRMNAEVLGSSSDPFYEAPAMLIVLADRNRPTYLYDGSIVMQNLMLAAHSLGVDTCWIHRAKEEFDSAEGKEILRELGISGNYEGIGHCALGYATAPLQQPKPRKDGYVVWAK